MASAILLLGLLQAASGEALYQKKCSSCHGARGEGTAEYPDALVGDRSVENLGAYVQRRMPKDKPKSLSADEAKAISAWMSADFYSPAAQLRRRPARIGLSHLTVGQFRNSVADLFASFEPAPKIGDRKGLRAEFSEGGRRFRSDRRKIDRIDPEVRFAFGDWLPAKDMKEPEFSARWSGSLLAPDTGEYEFVVETDNGVRLWVNDLTAPLVDRWVRSGDDREHRGTVLLLGGRRYPIRLEFFKEKKETKSAVTLRWIRPHGADAVLGQEWTTPDPVPQVCVVRAPFPPDDRSTGYERGATVSKAWDEAVTYAALEAATTVAGRLPAWTNKLDPARVRDVGRRFVERAFGRPLDDATAKFFVDRSLDGVDAETGMKRLVLLVLKSPRFLFPGAGVEKDDGYAAARRIAAALWDSIPDAGLLEAAKLGRLDSPDGVRKEIEKRLDDPRARARVRAVLHSWLQLDRLHDLTKDEKLHPEFTEEVVADLRTSLDLFLDEAVWEGDFKKLLLSDQMYLNGRLSKVYGGGLDEGAPFQKVGMPGHGYAGLLTHPLLMAGFAYDAASSPIHRGVFLARSLLGRRLRPPPDAQTPVSANLHPSLSTRERIALQTRPQACMSCHSMINPLGFTLENFDAVGRWRSEEKGKPIDARGAYEKADGSLAQFNGPRELATFLADSPEAHAALVEHLFHALVRQPILAYGLDVPDRLRKAFAAGGFRIKTLIVDILVTSALNGKGKTP